MTHLDMITSRKMTKNEQEEHQSEAPSVESKRFGVKKSAKTGLMNDAKDGRNDRGKGKDDRVVTKHGHFTRSKRKVMVVTDRPPMPKLPGRQKKKN